MLSAPPIHSSALIVCSINLDQERASIRDHGHRAKTSARDDTNLLSIDYIDPAGWSVRDNMNSYIQSIAMLEAIKTRRNAAEVYQTWGSEGALPIIRQNLALLPNERDVHDEVLLPTIESECDAVLNENNTVFIDLYNRIVEKQRRRSQYLSPIQEETSDLHLLPLAPIPQRMRSNTNKWSDFDSDDEDLPDISGFLPGWVKQESPINVEQECDQDPAWWRIKRAEPVDSSSPRSPISTDGHIDAKYAEEEDEDWRLLQTTLSEASSTGSASPWSSPPHTPLDTHSQWLGTEIKGGESHLSNAKFQVNGDRPIHATNVKSESEWHGLAHNDMKEDRTGDYLNRDQITVPIVSDGL